MSARVRDRDDPPAAGINVRAAELRVLAGHATALSAIERGEADVARTLARLVELAGRAGLPHLAARVELTLAWLDLEAGRLASGAGRLAASRPDLRGADVARGRCLGGLLHCAHGRHADALVELSAAVPALRRHDDPHWLANALVGRGTAAGYLRRTRDADADLAAASALFGALGERSRSAACVHNRGFVALTAGDLATALRRFVEAEAAGLDLDRHPEGLVDRAQALVAAGLAAEARPVLTRAADLLTDTSRGTKLAEATLAVAHCALRTGQPELAAESAATAAGRFGRQGRTAWRAAARAVHLTARLTIAACATAGPGEPASGGSVPMAAVGRVAADCDRYGWPLAAAELRTAAADHAAPGTARALLAEVAAHRDDRDAAVRALAWLARARLAAGPPGAGDRRAVLAACRAGLRSVDRAAVALGAWEPQAAMAVHTVELAELGLAAALRGGRPRTVLRWTDLHRAVAGGRPPLASPADPVLAERLVALRAAAACGRRVRALETRVRTRDWASAGPAAHRRPWSFAELAGALGRSALLSVAFHRGQVHVSSFVDGRCRLWRLGSAADLDAAAKTVRFGEMLTVRDGRVRSAGRRAAAELDESLFGPLARLLADRPVVLVPAGALHGVPWGALPSRAGRPLSVAPSVSGWLRARGVAGGGGPAVWLAGPGLRHAEREVRSLRGAHGGRALTGRRAGVAEALAAMDGAALAHIAAHGEFRDDQPLFSCVELADGPLYGYDVQRLARAPTRVVLSACDAGRAAVRPGGEAIGMATAWLRAGSAAVVASVLPVPDDKAVALCTALHRELDTGAGPATALARAQATHEHLGFVCFGAG